MVSWLTEEAVADRYPGIVLPAYFAVPDIQHTRGPTVGRVAALAGIPPDAQQQLALDIVFAVKSPEDQLALVATLCIIVGRQVMKSTLFEMVLLGWLFVTGEVDVTYSAHEDRTAAAIWRRLTKRIKDTPQLAELLPMTENRGCYSANGQRRIELADGRQIEFVTRTEDGSRGLGKAKVIIDEAYAATVEMFEAILPLILAQRDPQVLFASMAGKAASAALRGLRDEGRGRTDPDGAYLEWCAPPAAVICDAGEKCTHVWGRAVGCGFDKPEWRKVAMPSYLVRLTQRAVDLLRKRLSPRGFGRECYGWWDEPTEKGDAPAFKIDRWRAIVDDDPSHAPEKMVRFGVDCDLDGSVYSFGAAGRRDDDRMHLEFVSTGRGEDWALTEAKRIDDEHGPVMFAIDGGGPAKHLIEPFTEAGLSVEVLDLNDHIAAARALLDGVNSEDSIQYVHGPQPELDEAVEAARLRRIGERGNGLGRRKSAVDITPITSVMFAAWLVEDLNYDLNDSFG